MGKHKTKKKEDNNLLTVLVVLTILVGMSIILTPPNEEKETQLSEPNYYGLALLGLVPDSQDQAHSYWNGDKETGIVAVDPQGNQYHLIKDAFGRTFLR